MLYLAFHSICPLCNLGWWRFIYVMHWGCSSIQAYIATTIRLKGKYIVCQSAGTATSYNMVKLKNLMLHSITFVALEFKLLSCRACWMTLCYAVVVFSLHHIVLILRELHGKYTVQLCVMNFTLNLLTKLRFSFD